ncbi:MAG: hypothetical protein ACYDEY_13870 [Acidimicrobiales bacterium]
MNRFPPGFKETIEPLFRAVRSVSRENGVELRPPRPEPVLRDLKSLAMETRVYEDHEVVYVYLVFSSRESPVIVTIDSAGFIRALDPLWDDTWTTGRWAEEYLSLLLTEALFHLDPSTFPDMIRIG